MKVKMALGPQTIRIPAENLQIKNINSIDTMFHWDLIQLECLKKKKQNLRKFYHNIGWIQQE